MKKKLIGAFIGLLVFGLLSSGCKKEPTQEEVEASQYYIQLQSQLTKSEKKNKKLTEKLAAANKKSPEEIEIDNLLDKIGRDSLVKMEVSYGNTGDGSVFTDNKGVLGLANDLAMNADLISRYTVDEIVLNYKNTYNYVLYDEDNSVFELTIYEGDFLVFKDLPDKVFYSYGANNFGDAFLTRQGYYPNESLHIKLIETPLVVNDKKAYGNAEAESFVTTLESSTKKKVKEKSVKEKLTKTYTFYYHDETIVAELGKTILHIEGSGKDLWYKLSKEDITKLKDIFTKKQ